MAVTKAPTKTEVLHPVIDKNSMTRLDLSLGQKFLQNIGFTSFASLTALGKLDVVD